MKSREGLWIVSPANLISKNVLDLTFILCQYHHCRREAQMKLNLYIYMYIGIDRWYENIIFKVWEWIGSRYTYVEKIGLCIKSHKCTCSHYLCKSCRSSILWSLMNLGKLGTATFRNLSVLIYALGSCSLNEKLYSCHWLSFASYKVTSFHCATPLSQVHSLSLLPLVVPGWQGRRTLNTKWRLLHKMLQCMGAPQGLRQAHEFCWLNLHPHSLSGRTHRKECTKSQATITIFVEKMQQAKTAFHPYLPLCTFSAHNSDKPRSE